MARTLKDMMLILFAAAYFAASQITVITILSSWYSTGGNSTVAMHGGSTRDFGVPSWTPRTHVPLFQHPDLSPGVPSSPFLYPAQRAYRLIQVQQPPADYSAYYSSGLCNKAPPVSYSSFIPC